MNLFSLLLLQILVLVLYANDLLVLDKIQGEGEDDYFAANLSPPKCTLITLLQPFISRGRGGHMNASPKKRVLTKK